VARHRHLCLASAFHATARPATIRDQLINMPARIATSARRLTLHLPTSWRWEHPWRALTAAPTDHTTEERQWKRRADRPTRHAHTRRIRTKDQLRDIRKSVGGLRLSLDPG
jgi:hypothetical protein